MYSVGKMIKRLMKYVKPYRLVFYSSIICAIVYCFATLYAPYIIGQEIINLFKPETFEMSQLVRPFIKLSIVIVVGIIFGFLMGKFLNVTTYKMVKDLQIDCFNKLLNMPVSYLDSHIHGDILTRVTSDVDKVWDGLLHGFTHIFRGIVAVIITIIFMFLTRWDIALLVVFLTPLSLIAATLIAKKSRDSYAKQAKITGEMGGLVNEMISEQKTVIAYNLMDENNKAYQEMDKHLHKVGIKAQFTASFANPTTRLVNAIVYAAVALFGAIKIVTEKDSRLMNVGMLAVFLFYASQYTRPFNEISGVAAELAHSFACLRRIYELLDEENMKDDSHLKDVDVKKNEFKIKNVNFSYNKNKQTLKDINVDILENKRVAIVGPTGCGKTTFINLLMRFYDVDSGEIILDKNNINNIKRNSLRQHIGMVLQDTWLFKGTVKENIRYSKLDATDDEIETAAIAANAHDFISKLPQGYNTIIDDDEGLSIGQKQLICIARLMLNLPNILILDEATSNIDTRTEVNIQKAFDALMDGRTSLVIAHRLSTIRNADLILVMKDGKIIERGNHDELIKLNGFYKSLYEAK